MSADGTEIFFKYCFFDRTLDKEELEEIFNKSTLSSYCNKNIKQYALQKTTFKLDKYSKELIPLNTSIYDYEYFYNKKKISPIFKGVYINQEENYFYISVEPYDRELYEEDIEIIENQYNYKSLEKILNKEFSHVEIY